MTRGRSALRWLAASAVLCACAPNGAAAGVEIVSSTGGRAPVDDEAAAAPEPGDHVGAVPEATVVDDGNVVGVIVDDDQPGGTVALPLAVPVPATVAVVGDSLTLSAKDEIEEALDDVGLQVLAVDGMENRRMASGNRDLPPGVAAIDAILDFGLEPELWIIALGTNDVGAGIDAATFRDDVAEVLTTVPPGVPVIWVDVWIRDRAEAAAEANRAIRSVSAMRPSTLIVDWYGHGDDPGIIVRDGVHLSDAGRRLFAGTMAAAVDQMFAG